MDVFVLSLPVLSFVFVGYQDPDRQRTYRVKSFSLFRSQGRVIPNSGLQCQYIF
jgi:hypothetical protein